MGRKSLRPVVLLDVEDEDVKAALLRDPWVLLPQRAGGGVPRVPECLFAVQFLVRHELLEDSPGHIDLAAHLQEGNVRVDMLRDGCYGAEVFRNVFAGVAVAPGRTADQFAAGVLQRHREAVDLRLHVQQPLGPALVDTLCIVLQLTEGKGVLQTLHAYAMWHRSKERTGPSTHVLCRRVRRDEFRILFFQSLQLVVQAVVLVVLNGRGVLVIVEVTVVFQGAAELLRPVPGAFRYLCHDILLRIEK